MSQQETTHIKGVYFHQGVIRYIILHSISWFGWISIFKWQWNCPYTSLMVFAFTNYMVSLTINDSKTCQKVKSVIIKTESDTVMTKYFTCTSKRIGPIVFASVKKDEWSGCFPGSRAYRRSSHYQIFNCLILEGRCTHCKRDISRVALHTNVSRDLLLCSVTKGWQNV